MFKKFFAIAVLLAAFCYQSDPAEAVHRGSTAAVVHAGSYTVANYPNAACEQVPSNWGGTASTQSGNDRYVDPGVAGNDSNNGAFGTPWKTWAHAKAAYAAGDTIHLYGGTFSEVFDTQNKVNSVWTRVMAVTGQTPIFPTGNMSGAQRWLIQGIKFQHDPNIFGNFDELFQIHQGSSNGKNIVLDSDNFSSADDGSTWTQTQWKTHGIYFGLEIQSSFEGVYDVNCVAVSRSLFAFMRSNLEIDGQYILAADNEFSNFGYDVIDPIGSDINIVRNYAHDGHDVECEPSDPVNSPFCNHLDFVQLQQAHCLHANSNDCCPQVTYCIRHRYLIDGNVVIERTSTSITTSSEDTGAALDGIAAWDEAVDGMTVTNNVIISSTSNLITLSNTYNAVVANNTVIATDGGGADPGHYGIAVTLHGNGNSSGAPSSHDVRFFNNVASNIELDAGVTLTADHNDILVNGWYADNTGTFYKTPQTIAVANIIRSQALSSYFVGYNYSTRTWDLHLKAGSLGIGAGTITGAPNHIDGTARTAPVDVGAY